MEKSQKTKKKIHLFVGNNIMKIFYNQIRFFIASILLTAWSFWVPVVLDYYDLILINMKWQEWFMSVACFYWLVCWAADSFINVFFYLNSLKEK